MNTLKKNNQVTGNMGLYYVCYELSKRGWNVLPTARNAKGIDIIAYSENAEKKITIQVKSLSKKNPVPFGSKMENKLIADFVIICSELDKPQPKIYVATSNEIKDKVHASGTKNKPSYWLEHRMYAEFEGKWGKIGDGF